MSDTRAMLATHPDPLDIDADVLAACIRACLDCAQTCTACADACLAEDGVAELVECIRTDLDCADVCAATGRVLSRRNGSNLAVIRSLVNTCRDACRACAAECEDHAEHMEHCRICAETCRRCEQACDDLLAALA